MIPRVNLPTVGPHNFVDRRLFTFMLNHEVHKATRFRYTLSILCLSPDFPPTKATFINELANMTISHLRASDLASTLHPDRIALLLLGAEARDLAGILQRVQQALEPYLHLTRGRNGPYTLSAGGGCFPQTASSGSELLGQAVDLMTRAKGEGGNRLYLPPRG